MEDCLLSLLKQKIIGSAMQIFAEKGYAATSIQDIANDCGIAKGSLYKFFASKEDLLVDVYRHLIQEMFEQAERLKADTALSPKARFVRETHHQFLFFSKFKSSIQDFYELPINEDGVFSKFIQQMRSQMLVYFGERLVDAYGPEIEQNKWDLVALYAGILKEYMIMTTFTNIAFDYERMSSFVVDRMDEMAAGIARSKPVPILEPAAMAKFVACGMEGSPIPAQEQWDEGLNRLLAAIQELQVSNARKSELHEAAALLREEAQGESPRGVLIRALIGLLQTQHELAGIVGQLEKLFESKRGKNNERRGGI